jgi:hypothetical protein
MVVHFCSPSTGKQEAKAGGTQSKVSLECIARCCLKNRIALILIIKLQTKKMLQPQHNFKLYISFIEI